MIRSWGTIRTSVVTACIMATGFVAAGAIDAPAQIDVAARTTGPSVDPAIVTNSHSSKPSSSPAPTFPSDYVIGVGDLLNVSVWKEKDFSETVVVRPDGKISLPLVGEFYTAGQTPVQAEDLLQARLKTVVIDPKVTVSVVEIRSRMVYITGEIGRPGAYPLNAPLNVLQLIAQAGGLTQFAERRKIRVLKASESGKGVPFDYNSVVHGKDSRRNLVLAPGDTVVVP